MVRRIASMNITGKLGANPASLHEGPLLYKNLGFNTSTQLLYGAAWLTFALGLDCELQQHPIILSHQVVNFRV